MIRIDLATTTVTDGCPGHRDGGQRLGVLAVLVTMLRRLLKPGGCGRIANLKAASRSLPAAATAS